MRAVEFADEDRVEYLRQMILRARATVESWNSNHATQQRKVAELIRDLGQLDSYLAACTFAEPYPWHDLAHWAEQTLSIEGQELVVSLLLEPYGDLVDDLADHMHADESSPAAIAGSQSVADTCDQLTATYDWALRLDWTQPTVDARAWYVSAEKLEPRLGERYDEPVGNYEQPLQPGRDAARMHNDLLSFASSATLADFLSAHPEHRHMARRLAIAQAAPYGEIRDNTIDATMLPIDLLRAKLSFFGATHFDPRSDRWVRIAMFRGAPFPDELGTLDTDDWVYPPATV